ncbi:MAG TPA: hypothetical protein VNQ77_05500 [Frankiaceae bacterium]|nr:hypothetical protein [Frankiaceae bacterium]
MRRHVRAAVSFIATVGLTSGFVVAGPGAPASATPRKCPGYAFLREADAFAVRRPSGGFEVCDPSTGALTSTHGPDTANAGAHSPLPTAESDVECVVHNYGPQVVFLYGHWYPTAWRYLDVRLGLQSIIRRMNHKLALAAAASGGSAMKIRTPCMLQDGRWVPWVGGFTNYPGSRSGAPDNSFADIREAMLDNYPTVGHDGAPIKYVVFYDSTMPGFAGQGEGNFNDDRRWNNANASTTAMSYVRGDYWGTNVTLHELFHTLGAVQYTAPHSNWVAHCNDGADVMCYDEQGTAGAYPGPYDDYRCSYTEEAGYVPLDCKYDTYFDASTPPGSYLGNYWNVAGPTNPFFKFANAQDFAVSATPASLSVNAGQPATSTVRLTSYYNFSGPVSLSVSGVPSGSSATLSTTSTHLSSNGTTSLSLTVRPGTAQRSSFTVTVTACGGVGCRSTPVTVTPRYFTVSASPSTVTTLPTQSAQTTVYAASRNGFSGSVTYSTSGVPAGSTVSVSPSSVSVPSGGSAAATVTVTTGPTQLTDYSFTLNGCNSTLCSATTVYVDVQPL